jgi:tetratricopeptide (TPR) repeat protein
MGKIEVKEFASLSPQQILAQRPGTWGDYELLDVLAYFDDKNDRERAAALMELILRSPEHNEMVAYDDLYFELTQYTRWLPDYPAAVRWAYGNLAYEEQRQPGFNRANLYRDIGEVTMQAGQLDSGLAIITRLLEADPADIWIYNGLAFILLDIDWAELALEVLDRALEMIAEDDPENLGKQLSDLREEALEEGGRQAEVTPGVMANLRAAMQLSSGILEDPDGSLPPVDALIALDEHDAESAYETIIAQGDVLAPDLIRMAFDEKLRGTPAPEHAVAILRRLSAGRAVEYSELAWWLERADGDWARELLTEWAGKIGGYYSDELIAIAGDTTYDLYVRSSMANALVERVQKCPEQTERIIQAMRVLLTRPEAHEAAEETFIGFLISDLTDMDAKELYPEIETAFAEDRVDPTVIDLQSVQEDFGMPITRRPKPREDGLTLQLRCKSCGRIRPHFVQHVLIDGFTQEKAAAGEEVKFAPFVTDREIVCPKCGSRDQYEATPQALAQIMTPVGGLEKLAARLGGKGDAPGLKLHPRVDYIQSMAFDRPMHPLEALERYSKLIKANPLDVNLYFRLGSLLRTIHRYPQMLKVYRQGYERGSDNPEFVLNRAMAEHDYGDRELAQALYEETIKLAEGQIGVDPYFFDLSQMAQRGQRALKRKKASPWQPLTSKPEGAGKEEPSWQRRKKGRRPKKKRRK